MLPSMYRLLACLMMCAIACGSEAPDDSALSDDRRAGGDSPSSNADDDRRDDDPAITDDDVGSDDDDTDPTVSHSNLIVKSDGETIGNLDYSGEYYIGVYDVQRQLLFGLNDATGRNLEAPIGATSIFRDIGIRMPW